MEIRHINQYAFLDAIKGSDQNNADHSQFLIFDTIMYVEGPEVGSREYIQFMNLGYYITRQASEYVSWKSSNLRN